MPSKESYGIKKGKFGVSKTKSWGNKSKGTPKSKKIMKGGK